MNEALKRNADKSYQKLEKKATAYFTALSKQIETKSYVPLLTKDFSIWQQTHLHQSVLSALMKKGKGKTDKLNDTNTIKWLKLSGKLQPYLERSVSYIYMRDLGKSLASPDTRSEVKHTAQLLNKQLTNSSKSVGNIQADLFSMTGLYRLAEKENIELTFIWLIDKLKKLSEHFPAGMNDIEGERKLIKIIAGVILHQLDTFNDDTSPEERSEKLDIAIRLGYAYGLTYPFIDDLLDSDILSDSDKKQYSAFIRETLLTGSVPTFEHWSGGNKQLIQFIHKELSTAFQYIKEHQSNTSRMVFFEQAYVFFHSQEIDRVKNLGNTTYTNEELFIPIILKSASSRLIVRSVMNAPEDEGFHDRTFYYGIYNQLADDFTDLFNDLEAGAVTPYTYYLKHHKERPDLINPFELYWAVIAHLIHDVYQSNDQTIEVILSRAINSQQRFKEKVGEEEYRDLMKLLSFGEKKFDQLIQKMVDKAGDVDFFDKLIRDHIITNHQVSQQEKLDFFHTIKSTKNKIDAILPIATNEDSPFTQDTIAEAANYSLHGGGKRLRSIMTWFMSVYEFNFDQSTIEPLLRSLEYMHTASLIFDDLPSQDNSALRRGQPSLHEKYNVATAELTGIYLTQKAVEEQSSLHAFDAASVLRLVRYSSNVISEMCKGQMMDLNSKKEKLTIDQLRTICFYKTGIAFEASLVMPAILADKQGTEIAALKDFAYHAGIAFQIKDDLLDAEGNADLLGKPAQIDQTNQTSTFVTALGIAGAKKEMWKHYCYASETLEKMQYKANFLKYFLSYIIHREY